MSWTEAIYDRVLADVQNRTAKGYLNISDRDRILENTNHVLFLMNLIYEYSGTLEDPGTADIDTIPEVTEINTIINNIEKLRKAASVPASAGAVALELFTAGIGGSSPDYNDVNDWERNLYLLKLYLINTAYYITYCGVSSAGQSKFWAVRFRTWDFVPPAASPVRRPRSGVVVLGQDMSFQNGFRSYG